MRLALVALALPLMSACNPESEAARVNAAEIELSFDENGAIAILDVEGIEKQKEKLKHELWTDVRIFGHIWTPVMQLDGTFADENWRIFSAFAPFSTEAPMEFRVGVVPDGYEQGMESRSSLGPISPFPEGQLQPGDKVSVGFEALNPEDFNVRVSLGRTALETVPARREDD
ncbi:MAG: hypothetical protein AB8H79_15990 [Myxococcota bacterium]